MEKVGVRELKDRLGHYLRAVRRGRHVLVMRRGEPVVRLVPVAHPGRAKLPDGLEDRMWELAVEGVVTWSGGPSQLPEPAAVNKSDVLLSDLIVEDRE